jgi:hypothetical protein
MAKLHQRIAVCTEGGVCNKEVKLKRHKVK